MNSPHTPNLLRRTAAVAFAAAAGFFFSGNILAQGTVVLSGASGNSCSYTSMSIQPNGTVSVSCTGTVVNPLPPNTDPGTFSINGPASVQVGQAITMTITRAGGNYGDASINWAASSACAGGGTVSFTNGGATTGSFTVTGPSAPGICNFNIGGQTTGSLGSPVLVGVNVVTTVPPVQNPAGCPTVPNDVLDFDLKLSGADRLVMSSGRIGSGILPGVKASGGTSNSGQILFGESTIAPRAARIEISVTKCRGVIDTAGGACYLNSSNPTFTKMEWIEKPIWGTSTDSVAQAYNLCKAYLTDGPFFVNVRYSYAQSDCQYGSCGFVQQWNYDSF